MLDAIAAAVLGAFLWSFLEYLIHRWLGHDARTRPNPFAAEHVRHHGEGNYFAPTRKKAVAALGFTAVMLAPAVAIAGATLGASFVLGFVSMYVTYEIVHRRDHTAPGRTAWGRYLRRLHFHHHFVDPDSNHGVTSPVWDRVFRTYRPPGRIRVPAKLAMPWLVDPTTGDVAAAHRHDYELRGRV